MVLVNIIKMFSTNSIHVPYNYYTWPFQFYSLYLLYMYIIIIIHVAHTIYCTFGN